MARPVLVVALLVLSVLAGWYAYASVPNLAYALGIAKPTVITGQTYISESGYYVLDGDVSCANITGEDACIVFHGHVPDFVLDCRGHSITGPSRPGPGRWFPADGIEIHSSAGGTVKNCVVKDFGLIGIFLHHSAYNTIINNTVTNSKLGIYNDGCGYNDIINNTVTNNNYGIYLFLPSSNHVSIANNTADANEIAGIYLFQSPHDNSLSGNTANANGKYGIWFDPAYNITLAGNTACGNPGGDVSCANSTVIDGGGNVCGQSSVTCGGSIRCAGGCS